MVALTLTPTGLKWKVDSAAWCVARVLILIHTITMSNATSRCALATMNTLTKAALTAVSHVL